LEWQLDSLAAAAANAVKEGADATTDAAVATTRRFNYTQISDKVPRVSGTQENIVSAGRVSEMDYQVAKRSLELMRDMEFIVTANTASAVGDASTARALGGVPAWINTNTSTTGTAGTGDGSTAAVNGTQRAFTETLLLTVLQSTWNAGGDPDCVMLDGFNKRQMSTFTGNATREVSAEHGRLHGAISYYESDWGMLEVIPNRFLGTSGLGRNVFILQKDMWAVAYLRQFQLTDLAKTGDSERKQLICEYTLEARNEASSGIVLDVTTS